MASIANEMLEIREFEALNVKQGFTLDNRISLLNDHFEHWVFTPDYKNDKILAIETENPFTASRQIEV